MSEPRDIPLSFDEWAYALRHRLRDTEEKDRFLLNARNLVRNPVLREVFSLVEARYIQDMLNAQDAGASEEARLMVLALRRVQTAIVAFAEDFDFEAKNR